MICKELIDINGKPGIKTFSDKNVYIMDINNILYPVAYDFLDYEKEYFESNQLIEE